MEGLLALDELDQASQSQQDLSYDTAKTDSDVLGRFILICFNEVMSLKNLCISAHLAHSTIDTTRAMPSQPRYTKEGATPMSQLGHRLLALWMVPYFLDDGADTTIAGFNGAEYLSSRLRHFTERLGGCRGSCSGKREPDACQVSVRSSPSRPLLAGGDQLSIHYLWGLSDNGNVICPTTPSVSTPASGASGTPTAIDDDGAPSFLLSEASYYNCSWLSCAVSVGMYMYVVMDVPWSLEAIAGRRLRWVLRSVCQDIERTQAASKCYQPLVLLELFLLRRDPGRLCKDPAVVRSCSPHPLTHHGNSPAQR